ncbi:MAG: hypothetical protein RSF40_09100 [Oscillospiraceae bacterium]
MNAVFISCLVATASSSTTFSVVATLGAISATTIVALLMTRKAK